MEVSTYILFVLGTLGATDILLYHSIAHGIRNHVDSRSELIVHSLRGPTYALLFVLIPNIALHGTFFWLLIGLFGVDVTISIADFALERRSRAFLGGLPTGEYILHIVLAMLFGALVTSILYTAGGWRTLPTTLLYAPAEVPLALRIVMTFVMAPLVLMSGIQDLIAVRHLGKRESTAARSSVVTEGLVRSQ
jgi:hypothetical protein